MNKGRVQDFKTMKQHGGSCVLQSYIGNGRNIDTKIACEIKYRRIESNGAS